MTQPCRSTKPRSRSRSSAAVLDWSEIDPSILGTLFERGLDPGKRAQLGAHYTDRDKIMLIVEPVVIRHVARRVEVPKRPSIAAELERAKVPPNRPPPARSSQNEAENRYRTFLDRLRAFYRARPGLRLR